MLKGGDPRLIISDPRPIICSPGLERDEHDGEYMHASVFHNVHFNSLAFD